MGDVSRVQMLLQPGEEERLQRFCRKDGRKRSTLLARLIHENLDRTQFETRAFERRAVR